MKNKGILTEIADNTGDIITGLNEMESFNVDMNSPAGKRFDEEFKKWKKEANRTLKILNTLTERKNYKPVKSYELASKNSL